MTSSNPAPAKRPKRPRHPMKTIFATVTANTRLTPRMTRIRFQSEQMAEFVTPYPDQFLTVLIPVGGLKRPPVTSAFTWDEYREMPAETQPHARNYTIRRFLPETNEVEVDFVLHQPAGFGAQWAERATPGMEVALWGPRVAYNPAEDIDWQLLIGDETGLPAIGAILDALPAGSRAHAVILVEDESEHLPLASAADVEVTWLHRSEFDPAAGNPFLNAVKALPFPEGRVYAWGGGEHEPLEEVSKFLRKERDLKTSQICFIGYWSPNRH
jgi:NADPH-dependent ferric siderophore reductase